MAASDPLQLLRLSITTSSPPTLSLGPAPSQPPPSIDRATHLIFTHPSTFAIPLNTPTRFIQKRDSTAIDLRSVLFAWEHRNDGIPAYVSACQSLGDGKLVKNLGFLERTDLITWLEGATDESDFIKVAPLDAAAALKKEANGDAVVAAATGRPGAQASVQRPRRPVNPRLAEIYARERTVGSRNSVLRGIRPTDFSHVRKIGEKYFKEQKPKQAAGALARPSDPRSRSNSSSALAPAVNSSGKARPSHPIILLSPSTSALLRMSNIKAFLEEGVYAPPSTSTTSGPSMLYVHRLLPAINPNTPTRFIVVDSPDQFKPDYWNRVAAVFTTGQAWQFKTYQWSTPQELFAKTKGVFVGYDGEPAPGQVSNWGNVMQVSIEKNRRFRDREAMENLWDGVEKWMVHKGWGYGKSNH